MMGNMVINMHEAFKKMTAAGLTEAQSEIIIKLLESNQDKKLLKTAIKEQMILSNQKNEDKLELLEQKVEDQFILLEEKMENHFQLNDQRHSDHLAMIEQKIEFSITKLETRMAKQDAIQKAWLMSVILTILGVGTALILKLILSS